MTSLRPVALRASLIAASTASAPLLQRKTWSSPSGAAPAIASAASIIGTLWVVTEVWRRRSTWAWTASTTAG